MKTKFLASVGHRLALAAGFLMLVVPVIPASAQSWKTNVFPAVVAAGSMDSQLPQGVKIIASLPLDGQPVTRMYTQDELGHRYLYIEHGPQSRSTVDVTRKRNPQIVDHQPAHPEPARYAQLWEGGSIRVSPLFTVNEGFDNQGMRGMLSSLDRRNPDEAKLFRAFGQHYGNLVDRDRRLVFFASTSYLFVVQDNRLTEIDFITN